VISNLVLSILFVLVTIAGIANSIAASRYAREAKAAAERSAAAARRAEAARSRGDAAREVAAKLGEEQQQSEPGHLTYEQLLPLAAAIRRRETTGHGFLLPPWPSCLTCGQTPTDLLVRNDHPAHFLEDRIAFGFRPCGHNFTADARDLYRATEQP
jgi:hypothetical protein